MKSYPFIAVIGITEVLIGALTLLATGFSLYAFYNTKPLNVLLFVLLTSAISIFLGIGILSFRKRAHRLLVYFASVVLISKILLLAGVIQLSGALETNVPPELKSFISAFYHSFVILYLCRPDVKQLFQR